VYLGAAIRILAGNLPYRDFTLIQPPGLPLLLTPIAALSHWIGTRGAMGTARILVPVVARGVSSAPDPALALDRLIPRGACVITDNPAYLIASDRYLGGPRCPPVVDPYGTTIASSGGLVANGEAARSLPAVKTWIGYFRAAQFLLLTPASGVRIPWDRTLESYVHAHFALIATQPALILRRAPEEPSRRGYSLITLAGA